MINWELSKQGLCWPVSRDHIVGSGQELLNILTIFLYFYYYEDENCKTDYTVQEYIFQYFSERTAFLLQGVTYRAQND